MPWKPSEHESWYVDPAALGEPPREVIPEPTPRPMWHLTAWGGVLLLFFFALATLFGALPSLAILIAGRETEAEIVHDGYVKHYRFEVEGNTYEGEGIGGKRARIDDEHIRVSYVAFAPSINDPYGSAPGRPFPHPWIWLGGLMLVVPALILVGKDLAPTVRHLLTRGGGAHQQLRTWPARVATVVRIEPADEQSTVAGGSYRSEAEVVRGTAHVRVADSETSFDFDGPPLAVGDEVTVLCKPNELDVIRPVIRVSGELKGDPPS